MKSVLRKCFAESRMQKSILPDRDFHDLPILECLNRYYVTKYAANHYVSYMAKANIFLADNGRLDFVPYRQDPKKIYTVLEFRRPNFPG